MEASVLPVFMIFVSVACYAVANLLDSVLINNSFKNVPTVIFYTTVTNCLASFLILFIGLPTVIPLHLWGYVLLIALIDVGYLFPYYISLKKVDTSVVAGLFSLGKIVVPVLAFFIVDERLGWLQYLGFGVIILFNLVLNIENPKKIKINISFWLMLFASVMLAVDSVLTKKVLEEVNWISYVFFVSMTGSVLCMSFLVPRRNRIKIIGAFPMWLKKAKIFLSMEVIGAVAVFAAVYGLEKVPASVYEGICGTQPIFVLLFGILLSHLFTHSYKESILKNDVVKKMLCFLMILGGVVCVLYG